MASSIFSKTALNVLEWFVFHFSFQGKSFDIFCFDAACSEKLVLVTDMVGNSSFWIGRLNLVLFYILGKYYRLSQRAAGIHLVFAFFFHGSYCCWCCCCCLVVAVVVIVDNKRRRNFFFFSGSAGRLKSGAIEEPSFAFVP